MKSFKWLLMSSIALLFIFGLSACGGGSGGGSASNTNPGGTPQPGGGGDPVSSTSQSYHYYVNSSGGLVAVGDSDNTNTTVTSGSQVVTDPMLLYGTSISSIVPADVGVLINGSLFQAPVSSSSPPTLTQVSNATNITASCIVYTDQTLQGTYLFYHSGSTCTGPAYTVNATTMAATSSPIPVPGMPLTDVTDTKDDLLGWLMQEGSSLWYVSTSFANLTNVTSDAYNNALNLNGTVYLFGSKSVGTFDPTTSTYTPGFYTANSSIASEIETPTAIYFTDGQSIYKIASNGGAATLVGTDSVGSSGVQLYGVWTSQSGTDYIAYTTLSITIAGGGSNAFVNVMRGDGTTVMSDTGTSSNFVGISNTGIVYYNKTSGGTQYAGTFDLTGSTAATTTANASFAGAAYSFSTSAHRIVPTTLLRLDGIGSDSQTVVEVDAATQAVTTTPIGTVPSGETVYGYSFDSIVLAKFYPTSGIPGTADDIWRIDTKTNTETTLSNSGGTAYPVY